MQVQFVGPPCCAQLVEPASATPPEEVGETTGSQGIGPGEAALTLHNIKQGRRHKKLRLLSANVTSLCKHATDLAMLGCDALLLQEPRFDPLGDQNRLRKDWGGRVYYDKSHAEVLAAIVILSGNFEQVALEGLPASMEGRVAAGLWWPAGAAPYLLVSIYGYTSPTTTQVDDLSKTLQAVLEHS